MRKRMSWIQWMVMVAIGMSATAGWSQELERIAFVDMERVFAEYYKTKRADTRLKQQAEEFNTERKDLIAVLRELEESFNSARQEAQDQTLSEEARDRKRSEAEDNLVKLREKENDIRSFEESRRKQLEEQGKRMRTRIVDEISRVLAKFAQDRDLFSVIDSSGPSMNQVPVFLYTEAKADITDEVLAILNKGRAEDEEVEDEEVMEEPVAEEESSEAAEVTEE